MYIYGKNVAREKLNSNEQITKIYLSDKFTDKEIFNLIKKKKIRYSIVPNKFLDNKVDGLHQGIVIESPYSRTYGLLCVPFPDDLAGSAYVLALAT